MQTTTTQITQGEMAKNEVLKLIDQHITEWRCGEKNSEGTRQFSCDQRARALEELRHDVERLRMDMIDQ